MQKTNAIQELSDETPENFSLTFNEKAQAAILGYLLKDPAFFIQSRGKLKPNYFISALNSKIYGIQILLFDEFKRMPTIEEIKNHELVIKKALPEETLRIYAHIEFCLKATEDFSLPFIKKGLTDWLRSLLMKDFLRKSIKNYDGGKVQDFFYDILDLRRKEEDYLYEDVHRVDFSDAPEWIGAMEENYSDCLITGLTLLDKALLEGPENGGILRGDTTCFMAPTGAGKCLGIDTPVIKYDGTIEKVQNIKAGDLLMGPDEKPRRVLGTTKGRGLMYKVTPKNGGNPFICNDVHVLSLKCGFSFKSHKKLSNGTIAEYEGKLKVGEIVNIPINEFVTKSKDFRRRMRLWRASALKFEEKNLPIDPYIFGLWIGDGHSDRIALTTADEKLTEVWCNWVKSQNSDLCIYEKENNKAKTYASVGCKQLKQLFRELNVLENKHIPEIYLHSSIEQRMKLLAGIIDSDGSYDNKGFDLITASKTLAENYAYLARSLGFKVALSKTQKSDQNGTKGNYFRLYIQGKLSDIPVLLDRKKAKNNKNNPLISGFDIEPLGEDDYYGFELDGDHLFLLGDFTVSHNTTVMFSIAAHNMLAGKDVLLLTHEGRPEDLRERIMCTMLTLMNVKSGSHEYVNKMKLLEMIKTDHGKKRIKEAEEIFQEHLVYYPYNKPGMIVEDVEAIIRRQQDKRVTLKNKGFDLLVDDYPAKLSTRRANQGFLPPHLEKEVVYDYFVQMAVEFNLHALVAVQTNREGFKQNAKGGDSQTLLGIDSIGDSYKISNIVTNFITINRSDDFAEKNKMILYVCKSKNSSTGRAIVCKTAFGSRLSHADGLGSIAYNNSVVFDNEADLVMSNKNNHGKVFTTEQILGHSNDLIQGD